MRLTRIALAVAAATASLTGAHSASALSAESCPPGYYGVVIVNDGRRTSVCNNMVYTTSCTSGTGAVVWVSGQHLSACTG